MCDYLLVCTISMQNYHHHHDYYPHHHRYYDYSISLTTTTTKKSFILFFRFIGKHFFFPSKLLKNKKKRFCSLREQMHCLYVRCCSSYVSDVPFKEMKKRMKSINSEIFRAEFLFFLLYVYASCVLCAYVYRHFFLHMKKMKKKKTHFFPLLFRQKSLTSFIDPHFFTGAHNFPILIRFLHFLFYCKKNNEICN